MKTGINPDGGYSYIVETKTGPQPHFHTLEALIEHYKVRWERALSSFHCGSPLPLLFQNPGTNLPGGPLTAYVSPPKFQGTARHVPRRGSTSQRPGGRPQAAIAASTAARAEPVRALPVSSPGAVGDRKHPS